MSCTGGELQHLADRPVAGEPLTDHGRGEAQHRHPPVQPLHPGQGRGVPWPAGGETLTAALHGLVVKGLRLSSFSAGGGGGVGQGMQLPGSRAYGQPAEAGD